jgi:hypothetical protein
MTSRGCQACPSEEIIQPLRSVAITLVMVVVSLFWFWYSWSPFFPSVGAYMNRIVVFIFEKLTSKTSENAKQMSEWSLKLIDSMKSLRIPQYFKIFIGYLQVMSSFLGFHVAWPSIMVNAMMWCKVTFNFNLFSLPGLSCLWKGLGYNTKLMLYTLIPLVLGFMFWMPVFFISVLKHVKRSSEEQHLFTKICSIVQDRFWNAIMIMCFLVSTCHFLPEFAQLR